MRKRFDGIIWTGLSAVVLLVCAGCATSTGPERAISAAPDSLQAGMAEIDITPPVGFRMAGYFDERLSTGIHDPLKAKALVLREGRREIALVFCDLVGMSLNVTGKARSEASRTTGIPITNIVIAATHSHTGPLFDDVRREYFHQMAVTEFGRDPQEKIDYPPFLTGQLVQVIIEAKARMQPVKVEAGIGIQAGLPFNRRYYMKNGKVAFNPGNLNPDIVGPAGPVDSDVGILLVKNAVTGRPIGGLTVFAMHADTTGGTQFSADYPFGIEQTLRGMYGSNYISAFGAGTCGDLNDIDVKGKPAGRGFEHARSLGDRIGRTVLAATPTLAAIEKPDLGGEDKTVTVPFQKVTPRQVEVSKLMLSRLRDPATDFYAKVQAVKNVDLYERGVNYPAEIQAFRFDSDTAIVCLPAEIFVQFGLAIKAASPFKTTLVISVCNDRPGYVPTLKAFSEGSYEVMNSRLQAGSGEKMVETAIKLLDELKR